MTAVPEIVASPPAVDPDVVRARDEMIRRLVGGGCAMRMEDLLLLLRPSRPEWVDEAIAQLGERGAVELFQTREGADAVYFPRW